MLRRIWRYALFWVFIPLCIAGFVATGWIWAYINFVHWDFTETELDIFLQEKPSALTEILDDDGNMLVELPAVSNWNDRTPIYRRTVTFADVPEVMINAALAAEDQRFFTHSGIDYQAIARASIEVIKESAWTSIRSFRLRLVFAEGGSTITQQVVRLTYLGTELNHEQTGRASRVDKVKRKIAEARRAIWLERELAKKLGAADAKERIFQTFANISYCGHGRYGFGACSVYYFGKPISMIDASEAALLAGMVRDPWGYSPRVHPELAEGRRNIILALMVEHGYLTHDDAKHREQTPIALAPEPKEKTVAPAVVQFVLRSLWGLPDSAVTSWQSDTAVKTTIKRSWQVAANDALEAGLNEYRARHPQHAQKIQGAIVVLDNQCRVRALVGGSQSTYTSFNRATEAKRQPGSAFKPFDYLAALENGFEWTSIIIDAPVSVAMGRGKPRHIIGNYDGRFFGPIPMWQGLAESRNGATARLGISVGTKKIIDVATRVGLNQSIEDFPTTTIGAEEVTPLELTCAYATLANGGIHTKPLVIKEVSGPEGVKVFKSDGERVIDEAIALKMIEGLRHTVVWRKGTGRSLMKLPFPVFGKTGTTNEFRDAWFCGSTFGASGVTICVWIGMDDRTPLGEPELCKPRDAVLRIHCEPGATAALPVFEKLIKVIYKDVLPDALPEGMEERILKDEERGVVRD